MVFKHNSDVGLIYFCISKYIVLSYWVNPERQVVRFPGACVIYWVYSGLYAYMLAYTWYKTLYIWYMTQAPGKLTTCRFGLTQYEGAIYFDIRKYIWGMHCGRNPLENQAIWHSMEKGPAIWHSMGNCMAIYLDKPWYTVICLVYVLIYDPRADSTKSATLSPGRLVNYPTNKGYRRASLYILGISEHLSCIWDDILSINHYMPV